MPSSKSRVPFNWVSHENGCNLSCQHRAEGSVGASAQVLYILVINPFPLPLIWQNSFYI